MVRRILKNKSFWWVCLGFVAGAVTTIGALVILAIVLSEKEEKKANLEKLNKTWECENCDLSGINLPGVNLGGTNLSGANLSEANLENADMRAMSLGKANLSQANLAGAIFREAYLTGANLKGANLKGAEIRGEATYLDETDLSGADLRGAIASHTNLKKANLHEALLQESDLESANLEGANLSGADLRKSNLKNANLKNVNLSGADLSGPETDLENADLTQAELSDAKLDGARLCQTIMPDGTLSNTGCLSPSVSLRNEFDRKNWKWTELEMSSSLLKAFERDREGWLEPEQIGKIPCKDLKILDDLWVKSSEGRFGFSVQRRIWESPEVNKDYGRFADRVGWRNNKDWVKFDRLKFSVDAPMGHLPWHSWQVQEPTEKEPTRFRRVGFGALMSKLAQCDLK